MTNEQVLAAFKLVHKEKFDLVKKLLARDREEPLSDIRITVYGSDTWHATVATLRRAYIFDWNDGVITISYAKVKGFAKNGSLITQTFMEWLDDDFTKGCSNDNSKFGSKGISSESNSNAFFKRDTTTRGRGREESKKSHIWRG